MTRPVFAADAIRSKRTSEDFTPELAKTGWYHSMELPSGVIHGYHSLDELRQRWSRFPLPVDLSGTRLLDIGAWDGWFTFEAERRGAEVVAIDNVEQDNFHYAHRELGSRAQYKICEIYRLPELQLGKFDYTLFLGVLYHLRHPLRALEIVCALTTQLVIVDSFVVDDEGANATPIPWMEFYEHTELANQVDNWTGPTLPCLLALCRSAGFARVEYLGTRHRHAQVACYRTWEPPPETPSTESPRLTAITNTRPGDFGINFDSRSEEFLHCWFTLEDPDLRREDLRVEIGGFGVHAVALIPGEPGYHATFFLPPGLSPGWHEVRLRTTRSHFSNSLRIAVDMPVQASELRIRGAADAQSWRADKVARGGHIALFLEGAAANADRGNIRVYSDLRRLAVEFVSAPGAEGVRQVNVRMPDVISSGACSLEIRHGEARANIVIEVD